MSHKRLERINLKLLLREEEKIESLFQYQNEKRRRNSEICGERPQESECQAGIFDYQCTAVAQKASDGRSAEPAMREPQHGVAWSTMHNAEGEWRNAIKPPLTSWLLLPEALCSLGTAWASGIYRSE
jgi:hypothetical protein